MDQQGESTTRVTLEKVNLRGGLCVKQTSHLYLSLGNILILKGTFITEKRPNLEQSALDLSLSECEQRLVPALDH